MTPGARIQAAIELLDEISSGGSRPADGVVAFYFRGRRYIGAKDRRAIADLVYGVLRRRARLDWWITRTDLASRDGRSRVIADLVLNERCDQTAIAALFDNKDHSPRVLTGEEKQLIEALAGQKPFHHDMPDWVRGEYPEWLEPQLRDLFGEDLAAEMGVMRDEAPLDLRVNSLKADRAAAVAALAEDNLTATPTALSPLGLRLPGRVALATQRAFREGMIEVQDEGSQIVALLTGAQPGQAVVDFCAGAGGKTLALAACMKNKGRLIACDTVETRLARATERLRRAGIDNVTRRVLESEHDKWVKRNSGSFDRVLVDAPCTGTGTWRRNPDAKWRLKPRDLEELTVLQGRILASAARLVKPGGRLVYATCSLLPAEDEQPVRTFLDSHEQFELLPVPAVWAETIGTACPTDQPMLRLTPFRHGTDGFFAAVLQRKA